MNPLTWFFIFLSINHGALEEIQAHQCWLPTLPVEVNLHGGLGFKQLDDICFKQLIGHAEAAAWVQHLFRQEEAVLAVQIAGCPGWLG